MYISAVVSLPVIRTLSLLRISGICYEKAVEYHRLIGYWTVALTWIHGVGCYIAWIDSDNWWQQVCEQTYTLSLLFHRNLAGSKLTWFASILVSYVL